MLCDIKKMEEKDLNLIVEKLNILSDDYKNLAQQIVKTKAMKVDFIALSILNRAISINEGFKTLFIDDNVYAACHLIRIQLDSLLRYNSILIAKDKSIIDHILEGNSIRDFNDSILNKKFTDTFLVNQLSQRIPTIKALYDKYCGLIHFSNEHIERIKTYPEIENVKFRIEIGNTNNYTLEEKIELVTDMIIISLEIYNIINDWTEAKETLNN